MARWVPVPQEVAEQHPLHGLRGWLRVVSFLFAVAAVASPILVLYFAAKVAALPGWMLASGLVMLLLLALGTAASIVIAVLWFRLAPNFLAVFVEISVLTLVMDLAGDLALLRLGTLPDPFPQPSVEPLQDIVVGALSTAIPWWLLHRSRRYRATFRHELRADDPLLRGPVPRGY